MISSLRAEKSPDFDRIVCCLQVVAFYPRNPAFASPSEGPSTFPWYWAVFALLVLPIPSLAQPLSLERLHIFEEVIEQKELMRPEGDLDGYTTNCSLEALQCLYQFCRWLIFNAPRDIFATPRIVEVCLGFPFSLPFAWMPMLFHAGCIHVCRTLTL